VYQREDEGVEALRLLLRVGPEEAQIEFDRVEGLGANNLGSGVRGQDGPAAVVETQD